MAEIVNLMSFHDDLKKRFLNLGLRRQVRETPAGELEEIPYAEQEPLWDMVAREAIRQMEWARRLQIERCPYDCKGCPLCDSLVAPPITLAPEDWKP